MRTHGTFGSTKTVNPSKILPEITFLRVNLTHLLSEILLPEKNACKQEKKTQHGKGQSEAFRRGDVGFPSPLALDVTQANLFMVYDIMGHSEKVQ